MAANRILLVEDDHAIADAVALNLRTVGYEVSAFDDGGEAAATLEKDHSFDIALLDIMLPGLDGFALFALMEKYNIPVIYMTAKTDSESEVRGLKEGAEDYIVKPFEIVTLLVRIEKVLARTGRLNQVYRFRDGKTTLIRDLIRQISDGNEYIKGCSVGVVDERSELGGCYLGIAQNHLGTRTDILDCCPKAEGMIMLIRSMAPRVIAVDEIGTSEDIHAIEYAMQCGCRLIASVHSLDMDEASKKPILGDLIRRRMFQRYVVLGQDHGPGKIREIYDERGRVLCRN